jgi:hypothetical protein
MAVDESRFEALLAGLQQEWESAETSSRWDPPDGAYNVRIVAVTRGIIGDEGDETPVWRIRGRIEAPGLEVHDADWTVFFFLGRYPGFIKDYIVATLGPEKIPSSVKDTTHALESTIGWLLTVAKTTDTKKGRTNVNKKVITILQRAS